MTFNEKQTGVWLLTGAILGALFVRGAFARPRYTRQLLVIVLVLAALAYVLFARDASEMPFWLRIEFVGVGIYGTIGLRGLRGSLWWLVAGWALHPLWDIVLHYLGQGSAFAPSWYTVSCVSFDLVVAGYIAFRIPRLQRENSGFTSLAMSTKPKSKKP